MFTAVARFSVPEVRRAGFECTFVDSMSTTLVGVPGMIRAQLLRPTTGDEYLVTFEFTDEAAYAEYLSSEAFRRAHEGDHESASADERVSTYETVLEVPE